MKHRFGLICLCLSTIFSGGGLLLPDAGAQATEPLRISSAQSAEVRKLCETVAEPSSYSKQVQSDLMGGWKRVSIPATNLPSGVMLRSLSFRPDGVVEYSCELPDGKRIVNRAETYQVVHRGSEHQLPGRAPNIVINPSASDDGRMGLLIGVSVDFDNRFPTSMGKILKFKDMDGNECIFVRDKDAGGSPPTLDTVATPDVTVRNIAQSRTEERSTDPVATKELSMKLREGNLGEPEQNKVILRLMNEGGPSCVPDLIERLGTNHSFVVRQNAIRALGKIGDQAAVPALEEVLNTPIVGDLHDEAEIEAVLRRNAVVALGELGDPKTLLLLKLIAKATHEYQSVRELAKSAIRNIEKPQER